MTIILTFAMLFPSLLIGAKSSINIYNLQCEYIDNPLGLDDRKPRFGWLLESLNPEKYGQRQTAYRILVSQDKKRLDSHSGDMWDTGWVDTNQTRHIVYQGKPLESDKTYYWKVQVKDESGNVSSWSKVAHWSTGIFSPSEWTASWIGTDEVFDPSLKDCNITDPWLRKTFEIEKQPSRAVMFVASVGYHELYVNGKKIGNHVLAPAVSNHTSRARYIAYDIANELQPGKNVIALWLGSGWSLHRTYITSDKPRTPMVIAQANIANGDKVVRIQTDKSWKTHPSPNKLLGTWVPHNMGGELWDANKEIPGWNLPAFDDSTWKNVTIFNPKLVLSAQNTESNTVMDEIVPISIEERPDGSYRVDMGVNFAGWTEIKVKGNRNDRIDFIFSERQQDEMTFGIRSAYILGEKGHGIFRNRFNYSSGRWITIRGLKEKPLLSDIKGWLVRTNYKDATSFKCSDPLQNWIYDRVLWTFENLSIGGYIVDCPQRERLGYGGDAHATSETGLFNYQLGSFYTKWMEDWRDAQGWESMNGKYVGGGILPHTAPTNEGGGGPSWGGICITLPWFMYQHEGDTRILERNFEMMKKWLDFLDTHTESGLLKRFGGNWDFLGDWLWPNATAEGMNNNKPETICFNNCYRVFNLRTAAKIARVLGKQEEADKWEQQAATSSRIIHAAYFDRGDNSYADRSMANLAAALLADVPPAELRDDVIKRLEKEILEVRKGHIHVGITGGALLFKLLREEGRDDLIYSMTSQTDYPGWGYMKANDATTIWEMWEKDLPGHSLLHSSYLYPGAWYIDGVAGIRRDSENPGFNKFIVRVPLLKEEQINWANASFDSPAGRIKSSWKRENGKVVLEVSVPANTSAKIYFPEKDSSKIIEKSGISKLLGTVGEYTILEVPSGNYILKN
ncbi:alpha-L-rhamnosidase [Dysgonomonas sp. 521]|nr:alpha-L-rhamnosidase [Dysgonomonas sp. 521]